MFRPILCTTFTLAALSAPPSAAQDTFVNGVSISDADATTSDLFVNDDTTLDGHVCIGNECSINEAFGTSELVRFKWDRSTSILFDDTSSVSFPDRDWRLLINATARISSGGMERFAVQDVTANTIPFLIEGGTPSNTMYMDQTGEVGIGTAIPQADLHIVSSFAGLRLQSPLNSFVDERDFSLTTNFAGLAVQDENTTAIVVQIIDGAPDGAVELDTTEAVFNAEESDYDFRVRGQGSGAQADAALFVQASTARVGVGTDTPEEVLHIRTVANDTDAFALFDAAGSGSDAAFRLRQQGSVPTTWEFRNQESSGRLNVGIAGGNTPFKIDDLANNNLLRLGTNAASDAVVVTGRLLVNNVALNVPDYVFLDDYPLAPLAEVETFIAANGHLPGVPSAAQVAEAGALDMSQMQMVQLKKIEELTLHIIAQDKQIAAQAAANAALAARLARVEASVLD